MQLVGKEGKKPSLGERRRAMLPNSLQVIVDSTSNLIGIESPCVAEQSVGIARQEFEHAIVARFEVDLIAEE